MVNVREKKMNGRAKRRTDRKQTPQDEILQAVLPSPPSSSSPIDDILAALLSLAARHMISSGGRPEQVNKAAMIEHQLCAVRSLSSLLMKEEMYGLTDEEQDITLAVVLLLVLFDVSVLSFVSIKLTVGDMLDVLRGFSGAEKLAYGDEVRKCILDAGYFDLETLVGCPVELFYNIGGVLAAGKEYRNGNLTLPDFEAVLADAELCFRTWTPGSDSQPSNDANRRALGDAYRHACILRVLRFLDTYSLPCESEKVQASVAAVLDASATVPTSSPWFKRLLFPLFKAVAETSVPHQKRYVDLCISEIKRSTGFQHPAMSDLLTEVWCERERHAGELINVPWMDFVSAVLRLGCVESNPAPDLL
ncbi:hypothetical protein MW887_005782 [Aspergillus wentii]|nr:hypothetical protein MW887_005782 [Aspergillus wentii]